jgi:hypothetical protein
VRSKHFCTRLKLPFKRRDNYGQWDIGN